MPQGLDLAITLTLLVSIPLILSYTCMYEFVSASREGRQSPRSVTVVFLVSGIVVLMPVAWWFAR